MEREELVSSPWDPVTERVETVQNYTRGALGWTRGSISLPRGRSNAETGFLERWSASHVC